MSSPFAVPRRWRSFCASLALCLTLAVAATATLAASGARADFKSDPDPTTLCTNADGCDSSTGDPSDSSPSDPNMSTWDSAPVGSSTLQNNGYVCMYSSQTPNLYKVPQNMWGCYNGGTQYGCTYNGLWDALWGDPYTCVLYP